VRLAQQPGKALKKSRRGFHEKPRKNKHEEKTRSSALVNKYSSAQAHNIRHNIKHNTQTQTKSLGKTNTKKKRARAR